MPSPSAQNAMLHGFSLIHRCSLPRMQCSSATPTSNGSELALLASTWEGLNCVRKAKPKTLPRSYCRLPHHMQRADILTVYVHSPDRLASGVELIVVWDELKAAGTEVIFLRGDVESNAEGRVFMHMQGAFAEYEKTKIAERTRRGKKHWAEQHALVSFWEPYGDRFVKRISERRAHLVVDEERAAVVRNVFDWTVSKHLSQRAIAVRLTEQGVATSKGANQWQPAVIGFMLRNQIYKGVLKYNRAISDESDAGLVAGWEDPALAIVDDDT